MLLDERLKLLERNILEDFENVTPVFEDILELSNSGLVVSTIGYMKNGEFIPASHYHYISKTLISDILEINEPKEDIKISYYVHEEDRPKVSNREFLNDVNERGEVSPYYFRVITAEGNLKIIQLNTKLYKQLDAEGQINIISMGVLKDVTETIIQRQRAGIVNYFFEMVQHDSRNIMSEYQTNAYMMNKLLSNANIDPNNLEHRLNEDEARSVGRLMHQLEDTVLGRFFGFTGRIIRSFKRFAELHERASHINEVINYGSTKLHKYHVNISEFMKVFSESVKDYSPTIQIDYSHEGDSDWVVDQTIMLAVLDELANNCIKYTKGFSDNPCISIRTAAKDGFMHITIGDNGIGIPPSEIYKVKESGYRASNAKSSNVKGSGFGLGSIAFIITNILGGKFDIFSEGEGLGTKYTIRFAMSGINMDEN